MQAGILDFVSWGELTCAPASPPVQPQPKSFCQSLPGSSERPCPPLLQNRTITIMLIEISEFELAVKRLFVTLTINTLKAFLVRFLGHQDHFQEG
jgi:hypothetical protein